MTTTITITEAAELDYRNLCADLETDPIEFEGGALSIGDHLLPAFARRVREGCEPSAEYWGWLQDQLEGVQ